MKWADLESREKTLQFLSGEFLYAVITEYTIFKLSSDPKGVIFQCLQDQYTFRVNFREMEKSLGGRKNEIEEMFIDHLILHQELADIEHKESYPIAQFIDWDALLDWFNAWQKCEKEEKVEYLDQVRSKVFPKI